MSHGGIGIPFAALPAFIGPIFVALGLRIRRKERLVSGVPVSALGSAALGPVALIGQARPRKLIADPLMRLPCCWWRCLVQEYQRRDKSAAWVTIATKSSSEPFYLQDATGEVSIDPEGADLFAEERIVGLEEDPYTLEPLLASWGIDRSGFFAGMRKVRVKQTVFFPSDRLYVLGELAHGEDLEGRHERFLERLKAAKNDPKQMSAAGVAKDGAIDPERWDAFRTRLEEQFLKEEDAAAARIPDRDKRVVRKPAGGPMILSDKSEEELDRSLRWREALNVSCGIGFCALGAWLAVREPFIPPLLIAAVAAAGFALGKFALPRD